MPGVNRVADVTRLGQGEEQVQPLRSIIMSMERGPDWTESARPITRAACLAAADFAERAIETCEHLPAPTVSPSPLGGVTLSWWFGEVGFLARVFTDSDDIYFQQEDPEFRVETGTESHESVLTRIASLATCA